MKIFSFSPGVGLLERAFHDTGFKISAIKYPRPGLEDSLQFSLGKFWNPVWGWGVPDPSTSPVDVILLNPRGNVKNQDKCFVEFISEVRLRKPSVFVVFTKGAAYASTTTLRHLTAPDGYLCDGHEVSLLNYGVPQAGDISFIIGYLPNVLGRKRIFTPLPTLLKTPSVIPAPVGTEMNVHAGVPSNLTVKYWFERNRVEDHLNSYIVARRPRRDYSGIYEGDEATRESRRPHRNWFSKGLGTNYTHCPIHPWFDRRITISETLALCSAPADFIVSPDLLHSVAYPACASDIPYLFAIYLAKSIQNAFTQF